jgi:prophage regulatory protein
MATKFLRKLSVLDHIPFSESTLWRRVKDGSFPPPVRIGERIVVWRESDIERWEENVPTAAQPTAGQAA